MKKRDFALHSLILAFSALCLILAVFAGPLFAEENNEEIQEYLGMFNFLFRYVQENYVEDISAKDLYMGSVKGLFESLNDPHSVYLSDTEMNLLKNTTTGKFGGVGLYISKSDPNGNKPDDADYLPYVQVVAPIEGSPAYKAGVHTGDYIIKIEGESTEELTIDEVVDRLKGTPGTQVTVTILRKPDIVFDVEITRAVIELPTVKMDMIGSIGYLRIIDWTPYTDDRIQEAVDFFSKNDYSSIIVDLRGNPGGLLDAVVDASDLFLDEGVVVSTQSKIQSENVVHYSTDSILIPQNIPMAVMVNKGSASASEIFAGAMKDRGRAVIVGETTFGKGSVQWVRPFGETGFKLTIAHYYTPLGTKVDKVGITPDKVVELEPFSEEELEYLKKILEENLIKNFVDENPEEKPQTTSQFVKSLRKDGILLKDEDIRSLVREEYNRRMDFPPVYNLEFDKVLQITVDMIRSGEIR
ncbi:MAG: S41 family peptidase [Spirochaetales bacterium]|nr:S41 family peptidase [Spirochaetales bacterium]